MKYRCTDEASEFTGNSDLPTYRYARTKDTEWVFQDIFDWKIFESSCWRDNIHYSEQKDPSKQFEFTIWDLRKCLGICLVMSCVFVPSSKDY